MIQENLLLIAIAVFAFMLVGLILTVVELKHGAPKRQAEERVEIDVPKR